jgi:hypothetical protein
MSAESIEKSKSAVIDRYKASIPPKKSRARSTANHNLTPADRGHSRHFERI